MRRPARSLTAQARRWEELADEEFPKTLPPPGPQPTPTSDSGWCQTYTGWCLEQGDLTEPSDVDQLSSEAWNTIILNYGSCAYDTGCAGPISGDIIWTSDDLRVIARAYERLAEVEDEPERADNFRWHAEFVYDWADDVDAGRRTPPSPAPPP